MEMALSIALILLSTLLIVLVVVQARTQGMSNNDSSSLYTTRRGLEKTMHQTTIVISVLFLLLALIASLPIFGSGTPTLPS